VTQIVEKEENYLFFLFFFTLKMPKMLSDLIYVPDRAIDAAADIT